MRTPLGPNPSLVRSNRDKKWADAMRSELPVRMGLATGEAELREGITSVRCSTVRRG